MKKYLMIYTGGTIGSVQTAQGYAPSSDFENLLRHHLDALSQHAIHEFDFIALEPLIDSANLQADHWLVISRLLAQHWQAYNAFIILHGTDTMAYTASALSFLFQGQDKPIIITGSQIPLSEPRSDALNNVLGALCFAGNLRLQETCVYFHNQLLRGNRARKTDSMAMGAFATPNYPPLGQMKIQPQLNSAHLLPSQPPATTTPVTNKQHPPQWYSTDALNSLNFEQQAVVLCLLYPGMPATHLQALTTAGKTQALVLLSYGAGNIPGADSAWLSTLEALNTQGILTVNLTQCLQGRVMQGSYAASHALNQAGVIPGGDMTPEAAFAKLQVLIARGQRQGVLRQAFEQICCGEATLA